MCVCVCVWRVGGGHARDAHCADFGVEMRFSGCGCKDAPETFSMWWNFSGCNWRDLSFELAVAKNRDNSFVFVLPSLNVTDLLVVTVFSSVICDSHHCLHSFYPC